MDTKELRNKAIDGLNVTIEQFRIMMALEQDDSKKAKLLKQIVALQEMRTNLQFHGI